MNPPTLHIFLGPDAHAPGVARDAMRSELESFLEPEMLDHATLLVSELVTNSVRHGGLRPDQEIELIVDASPRGLRVEVAEPGDGFDVEPVPRPRQDGPVGGPAGGWGLFLVDRLSDSWGVENNGETVVWFEMGQVSQSR